MTDKEMERHVVGLISLTEDYLKLEGEIAGLHKLPKAEFHRAQKANLERDRKVEAAVRKATDARKEFLTYSLAGDLETQQKLALDTSRSMLALDSFDERQKIIIEYEFSFMGINPQTGWIFTPEIVKCLRRTCGRLPEYIENMHENEISRWAYSRDEDFSGVSDLNNMCSRSQDVYDELSEEVGEFLEGKRRVLEIGFLHQRMYEVIKKVKPSVEYHGIDISIPAVIIARRKGITAYSANVWHAIPYPDGYFDGSISSTVKASDGNVYRSKEVKRVLKNPRTILNFDLQ